jgi:ABC-2 type transport system ATP-binding protein
MPVLTATGAGVRHRRRWLFRDLDVSVEPGELVAVVGPPGSGRTTVLLALARRFRLTTGKIHIAGPAALGQVPDVSQPEPVFSVAEHVRERLALLGRPAGDVSLLGLDPDAKGWQLSPFERQVLGLILARLEDPGVIALDGLDDGLDAAEQAELWRLLRVIAESGVAVLVTAREVGEESGVTVIRLGGAPAASEGCGAVAAPPTTTETDAGAAETGEVDGLDAAVDPHADDAQAPDPGVRAGETERADEAGVCAAKGEADEQTRLRDERDGVAS